MNNEKEDLIGSAILIFVFIGLFVFGAYISLQTKEDSKNDNLNNPPTISNNNGLRGASRCGENNF